jgi:hypothetical protein
VHAFKEVNPEWNDFLHLCGKKAGQNMKKSSDNMKQPTPTKPAKATGGSSKPLPAGFIEDNTPSQQIFVGGLLGKPPKK